MRRFALTILALATAGTASSEVINIDNDSLQNLMAEGVPVIDVRTAPEWQQTGIVAGSHTLTFFDAHGRYDARQWLQSLQSIVASTQPVILICRSGNRTSTIAAFLSQQAGYRTVYNVRRGIVHWIAEGNPTVAPSFSELAGVAGG